MHLLGKLTTSQALLNSTNVSLLAQRREYDATGQIITHPDEEFADGFGAGMMTGRVFVRAFKQPAGRYAILYAGFNAYTQHEQAAAGADLTSSIALHVQNPQPASFTAGFEVRQTPAGATGGSLGTWALSPCMNVSCTAGMDAVERGGRGSHHHSRHHGRTLWRGAWHLHLGASATDLGPCSEAFLRFSGLLPSGPSAQATAWSATHTTAGGSSDYKRWLLSTGLVQLLGLHVVSPPILLVMATSGTAGPAHLPLAFSARLPGSQPLTHSPPQGLASLQARCERAGPSTEVVKLTQEALPPALEWGEILVGMRAAPVNPADQYIARTGGVYGHAKNAPPFLAGQDGVGVVAKVSALPGGWKCGTHSSQCCSSGAGRLRLQRAVAWAMVYRTHANS